MDAPHALLKTVWVPGDVVVEEDVANLEVDALAGGLSGHQHLDRALAKLLLDVVLRERIFMPPWMNPTRKPHALSCATR